ncbi:hypothetical protein IFT59_07140 [Rhizobium sp. CFBP 8752]|uniref:hypothetical protein n=1 Tax=Rhizobium sp. CFBP 8752 TaxID=2775301 RepID=UPI00177D7251|nr:hypothetical protein [Rhizobium sp. CFBP 8752]MBD8663026.1 hypothetical protein [Rhizobium sp. CFBP 8752]
METAKRESALARLDFERLSFDYEELHERLTASEDWGKLVVCHIYLDHILTTSLKDHMPKAGLYLDNGYKTFADKVSLCQALNILDDELARTLKSINSQRNKFAHRLVFDVPNETKLALFKEFSPTRPAQDVLAENGFSSFLITVVMLVEAERIYTQIIAEKSKEIAVHREKMLELAIDMFKKRND